MPPMPAKRSNASLICHVPRDERRDCRSVSSLLTSNRFRAGGASLGEQLAEAVGAVRLVVARGESLASQGIVAVAAGEAVSVPRLVLVRHAAASDDLQRIRLLTPSFYFERISNHWKREYLVALDTPRGKLILVASSAVDLLLARDEALRSDRILADHAAETLLVPLSGLVLHLLSTWNTRNDSTLDSLVSSLRKLLKLEFATTIRGFDWIK